MHNILDHVMELHIGYWYGFGWFPKQIYKRKNALDSSNLCKMIAKTMKIVAEQIRKYYHETTDLFL